MNEEKGRERGESGRKGRGIEQRNKTKWLAGAMIENHFVFLQPRNWVYFPRQRPATIPFQK